ncbi:hypothetical protein [Nonomuraea sp. NPDC050643]|uniref:hypothetical protein n=1 Tax=Nonomuraea sp. NPDC050643 TaxID=3155660 RepID=UPI0034066DA2
MSRLDGVRTAHDRRAGARAESPRTARPSWARHVILLAAAAAAFGSPTLLAVESAAAATPASGRLVLYRNTDFTGSALAHTYTGCGGVVALTGSVGSFDNRPLAGCSVSLQTRAGASLVLCAGRGVVPAAFRQAGRVLFRPGASAPCVIAAAAPA